jgi:hypothetical protein
LTLDEHEQARSDLVPGRDKEIAGGTDDASFRELKDHGDVLRG